MPVRILKKSNPPLVVMADGSIVDLTLQWKLPPWHTLESLARESAMASFIAAYNSCFIEENAECRLTEADFMIRKE